MNKKILKKVESEDLQEVISISKMNCNSWVIIEGENKNYKFYFINEGYYWCSISEASNCTNKTINECYNKAWILQSLYSIIHTTYDHLIKTFPANLFDTDFNIKDKCQEIFMLDLSVDITDERNLYFIYQGQDVDIIENKLIEILEEFGGYEIVSSYKSGQEMEIREARFETNLPLDLYNFAYGQMY